MKHFSSKAHDIAHAVFRVATLVRSPKLRIELENAAIELVVRYEEVANPALSHSANVIDILDRLISLAESVREMKPVNAEVLKRELGHFEAAIKTARMEDNENLNGKIDLSKEFRLEPENLFNAPAEANMETNSEELPEATIPPLAHAQRPLPNASQSSSSDISARQTAILTKIRETEFCRLRNLVEAFPDVSERTIRNDIHNLISNELVKRVGGGGPNSYFQSMEVVATPSEVHIQSFQTA